MSELDETIQQPRAVDPPRAIDAVRVAKPKKAKTADRTVSERLLDLSRDRMVDGIILSEVLGKPVSMRRRHQR